MKLNEIYEEVGKRVGIKPGHASHIVRHYFRSVRDEMRDPTMPGGIFLPNFGSIIFAIPRINNYIRNSIIPRLRKWRGTERYHIIEKHFKLYWKMRQLDMSWRTAWKKKRKKEGKAETYNVITLTVNNEK